MTPILCHRCKKLTGNFSPSQIARSCPLGRKRAVKLKAIGEQV